MSLKPCHHDDGHYPDCGFCVRWQADPAYRELWRIARASTPAPGSSGVTSEQKGVIVQVMADVAAGLRPTCRWQGKIVDECRDPSCSKREASHTRLCMSDHAQWTRCKRGEVAMDQDDVQSCLTCPLYEPELQPAAVRATIARNQ